MLAEVPGGIRPREEQGAPSPECWAQGGVGKLRRLSLTFPRCFLGIDV